ncbi:ATP-dependent RNA helicase [Trachipleistophora hominis]|uniref:ATP-dependent RNA helicase n=1 Tax=Trachipleistophora hominis TaxID=72359 RepID=L7JU75_TRAHO|nr:ATP-dependent RNA helicase [Trachipleistophora hominis]
MDQLKNEITEILNQNKITALTPIQALTVPYAIQKRNIIGISRTGTGKTLAYVLPALHRLLQHKKCNYVLVIVPTKDLVVQIVTLLRMFSPLGLKIASLIDRDEINDAHFIIGTPGALRKAVKKMKGVKVLVMDEVDKLFGKDYERDMRKILESLGLAVVETGDNLKETADDKQKLMKRKKSLKSADHKDNTRGIKENNVNTLKKTVQVMLFTATYDEALVRRYVDVTSFKVLEMKDRNEKVSQHYVFAPYKHRIYHLYELCTSISKCIIFVSRIFYTYLLSNLLKELNFNVCLINGRMPQKEKNAIIKSFKDNEYSIMITTDILSRGIDIPAVDNIINFDLPTSRKEYIHRVGRTARMSANGRAFSIVTQYDLGRLQRIEKMIGEKMIEYKIDENRMSINKDKVEAALEKVYKKSKLEMAEVNNRSK